MSWIFFGRLLRRISWAISQAIRDLVDEFLMFSRNSWILEEISDVIVFEFVEETLDEFFMEIFEEFLVIFLRNCRSNCQRKFRRNLLSNSLENISQNVYNWRVPFFKKNKKVPLAFLQSLGKEGNVDGLVSPRWSQEYLWERWDVVVWGPLGFIPQSKYFSLLE